MAKDYLNKQLSFEERARLLVEEMTIEEKAQQTRYNSPANKRLGIPEYNWWNEALHGVARAGTATVFPQAPAWRQPLIRSLFTKLLTSYPQRPGQNTICKNLSRIQIFIKD